GRTSARPTAPTRIASGAGSRACEPPGTYGGPLSYNIEEDIVRGRGPPPAAPDRRRDLARRVRRAACVPAAVRDGDRRPARVGGAVGVLLVALVRAGAPRARRRPHGGTPL